jgi:CHAT domain-containing protein
MARLVLGCMTWLLVVLLGQLIPQRMNTGLGHPFKFERPVLAIDLTSIQPPVIEDPRPTTVMEGSPLRQINDLEQAGRDALKRQHYTTAQRDFSAAMTHYERMQQWADAAGSAYMLSRTYFEMGEFAAATIALERGFSFLGNLAHPVAALSAQLQAQRGQLQYANGQLEQAIDSWEAALSFYQEIHDAVGAIATQLDLAAIYHELGLYQRAHQQLTAVRENLDQLDLDRIETIELQTLNRLHLADVELMIGQQNHAQDLFEEALGLARQAQLRDAQSTLLSRLARLAHDRGDLSLAVQHYREAAALSLDRASAIAAELGAIDSEMAILTAQDQPQINPQASLRDSAFDVIERPQAPQWLDTPQTPAIDTALQTLLNHITDLPNSQAKARLQVHLTERVRDWRNHTQRWAIPPRDLATGLSAGIVDRRNTGDHRTQAQLTSELAQLYGDLGDFPTAIELTHDAITLANQAQAMGIAGIYHHHLGRWLIQANRPTEALESYRQAIAQFRSFRQAYALSDSNTQLSFQNTVEPIYREAIGLLLQPQASQEAIREARDLLEALQVAEIANYFRANCLTSRPIEVGNIDPQAAILYPIVLPDRLEILLSLPDNTMQRHTVVQPQAVTLAAAAAARSSMSRSRGLEEQQDAMQRLDHWMIDPFRTRLEAARIETLVFVLDAPLRTIPMTALFDGQHYAIERYNIALAPSLQLLETTPQHHQPFSVFLGALEDARQGFRPLPGARDEVKAIAERLPSELLLNQQFTLKHLKNALRYASHPIIHLATHGQFGSTPDSTFVLAWDGKLNLTDFRDALLSRDEVRHGAIELLVLSACQTAIGDKLAILGMAGFAVQSGARATIASLWGVNDDATAQQMTFFYEALAQPEVSKAEALRQAQIKTIALGGDYAKPFYWAPFVLIGNWL